MACYFLRLAFSTQLNSLEVCLSKSLLCILVACFLFIAESYSLVWLPHSLLNYSPVGGCLGRFQFLTGTNKAALNIHLQISV